MIPAQGSIFFLLLPEIRQKIFFHVLETDGNLSSRLVCRDFLCSTHDIIKAKWSTLIKCPPTGPLDISLAIDRVQKPFLLSDGTLQKDVNYLHLFRALNREWKNTGVGISNGELRISYGHFVSLQDRLLQRCLDFSLTILWNRVWPQIGYFGWFHQDARVELRNWLYDPETEPIRSSVDKIDLSDQGIRYVPVEICCFPSLTMLNLSQNHIEVLPFFIGRLKELQRLNLRNNDIQELPEDFPNWIHLSLIDLRDNSLNESALILIEKWKENVENFIHVGDKPVLLT
jgi:Leucine-rich repeat (LRR) protein